MNKLYLRRKKNNKGSTLIIVIVVLAMIAVLATTTLSAALLNYRMKIVGSQSKKSFYTAEEAVDQVYACLGVLSMENLKDAYDVSMANITRQDGSGVNYIVSNEKCNSELRVKFAKDTLKDLFNNDTWAPSYTTNTVKLSEDTPSIKDTVKKLMNSYIEDYTASNTIISVKSVGNCRLVESLSTKYDKLYNYTIEIDDVAIEYKNEQGFFSNVTVDTQLALPDMMIDFTDVSDSSLLTFADYAIIGCGGVDVNDSVSFKLSQAKLYAGTTGIKLNKFAKFSAVDATVNTPGDITLDGVGSSLTNGTELTVNTTSKLWCHNLTTTSTSMFSTMNLSGSVFIEDDLDVDGNSNIVNINGNYVGFSYEGGSLSGHANSSAMMLNGQNCSLNMNGMTSLLLGGRSYVSIAGGYGTGESVSLKANQEVYLVPDTFIRSIADASVYYSNPTPVSKAAVVNIPDSFFAKKYLDATTPYVAKDEGGYRYYYLNFKSNKDATNYINEIINYNASSGTDEYIESYRRLLFTDLVSLQQSSLLTTKSDSVIYSNGSLVSAALNTDKNGISSVGASTGSGMTADGFVSTSQELKLRYMLLNRALYEPDYFTDGSSLTGNKLINTDLVKHNPSQTVYVINGNNVDISGFTDNVFSNFIDVASLDNYTAENSGFKVYCSKASTAVSLSGLDMNEGIIITRGDVNVDRDFKGLIFADGKVTITGSATVSSYGDFNAMLNKLTDEQRTQVQKFFKAWSSTSSKKDESALEYNIGGITYKHIIDFYNWRKSAPTIIDGEKESTSEPETGVFEIGL